MGLWSSRERWQSTTVAREIVSAQIPTWSRTNMRVSLKETDVLSLRREECEAQLLVFDTAQLPGTCECFSFFFK